MVTDLRKIIYDCRPKVEVYGITHWISSYNFEESMKITRRFQLLKIRSDIDFRHR